MNTEYKNFIGVYKDVYPESFCQRAIDIFEEYVTKGHVFPREEPPHLKQDLALDLNTLNNFRTINENCASLYDEFVKGLRECFFTYKDRFSILNDYNLSMHNVKVQRTGPGGGYHIWHPEKIGLKNLTRILVFNFYCNTLNNNEGGETEFLYQKLRIAPEKNTMLIFPADFTHTHRGNMVLGENNKYIITGWFYVHDYE
jgi:hypothetical protein